MRFQGIWTLSVGMMALTTGAACAQDYPSKPIRIITTAAGGGGDLTTRFVAQGITGSLGQSLVVDNRSSGVVATEAAAKAAPDGYTLTVGGKIWAQPLLVEVGYDVERDFLPITLIERTVQIVTVHPSVPAISVKELIALAKARPGELNFGAVAAAGSVHFSAEMLKAMGGMDIVRVPYKGAAPAVAGLLKGEVQLSVLDVSVAMPHIKAGKLKALAVTSGEPSTLAPGLPPVAAAGLVGYDWVGPTGMFAPAKTPRAAITRMNQEIVKFLARPEVKAHFLNAGSETVGNSPEEFAVLIKTETARLSKLIKENGLKSN